MSTVNIACIVEGHGEVEALPVLLRRMAQHLAPHLYINIVATLREKRAGYYSRAELSGRSHLRVNGWVAAEPSLCYWMPIKIVRLSWGQPYCTAATTPSVTLLSPSLLPMWSLKPGYCMLLIPYAGYAAYLPILTRRTIWKKGVEPKSGWIVICPEATAKPSIKLRWRRSLILTKPAFLHRSPSFGVISSDCCKLRYSSPAFCTAPPATVNNCAPARNSGVKSSQSVVVSTA